MKRIIFSFLCMFVAFQTAISQTMTWNQRYQNYFDKYKDVAVEQMLKYRIPASITLA